MISTHILEGQIQDALDNSAMNNFGVLIERDGDARRTWFTKGTPNERYISSSTSKPVSVAAILDQVARGRMTLRTKAVDVLPGFSAVAVGHQRDIELRHLLSFTAGMTNGPSGGPPQCWITTDWSTYTACIEQSPLGNADVEPGSGFWYGTGPLGIAGLMAVVAGGYPSWQAVIDEFRTTKGVFPGATWNPSFIVCAEVQINITAAEYLDFLNALRTNALLPPRLTAQMMSDQIPNLATRNGTTFPVAGGGWGEDWHFGLGLWLECHHADWQCSYAHRISSYGVAGQYGLIEREHGYRIVVTATFAGGSSGLMFARSIAPLLEDWAALGSVE